MPRKRLIGSMIRFQWKTPCEPMEQREKSRTCSSFFESWQRKAKSMGRRPTKLGGRLIADKCVEDELPLKAKPLRSRSSSSRHLSCHTLGPSCDRLRRSGMVFLVESGSLNRLRLDAFPDTNNFFRYFIVHEVMVLVTTTIASKAASTTRLTLKKENRK